MFVPWILNFIEGKLASQTLCSPVPEEYRLFNEMIAVPVAPLVSNFKNNQSFAFLLLYKLYIALSKFSSVFPHQLLSALNVAEDIYTADKSLSRNTELFT